MNEIENYNETIFESIKHIDEYGFEYWFVRELMEALQYKRWDNFNLVIDKAKNACSNSKLNVEDNFLKIERLSSKGNNAKFIIEDYKLSRLACYLIVQNADPRKEMVALGKTYIAAQTIKQELKEERY